jgi:putative hydrolase of the HAD superfamily
MSQPAWRSLQRKYSIRSLFDGATLSYKYGILKPDRRIFKIALENAHRSSSESIFIDDFGPNVATASSLGFRVHLARSPADTTKFLAGLN